MNRRGFLGALGAAIAGPIHVKWSVGFDHERRVFREHYFANRNGRFAGELFQYSHNTAGVLIELSQERFSYPDREQLVRASIAHSLGVDPARILFPSRPELVDGVKSVHA